MFRTLHPPRGRAPRDPGPTARPASAAGRDDDVERFGIGIGTRLALFVGAGIAGLGLDIVVYSLAQWPG